MKYKVLIPDLNDDFEFEIPYGYHYVAVIPVVTVFGNTGFAVLIAEDA